MKPAVMAGMSGGVDSSVAALLLQQQGYPVEGLFMKNWDEDDRDGQCSATEDLADAQAVCDTLGIHLHTRNFSAEYWDQVFEHFLAEYRAGRTPNPDILCNREIKFKTFLEHAQALGAERIATGHYARVEQRDGQYHLLRGKDRNKDQSYFLHALGQDALRLTLFPVGELPKPQVRKLAEAHGLVTAGKKDSTGICFIGERNFREFLSRFLPAQPGKMVTPEGQLVGEHPGVIYFTLGQRKGLGIGGTRGGSEQPWFVVDKDVPGNRLIVAQGHDHPMLYSTALEASQLNWINGQAPAREFRCTAKTRYRQADQPCLVTLKDEGCSVYFDQPQWAVTPGQSVVFYEDETCLGGGVIERRFNHGECPHE